MTGKHIMGQFKHISSQSAAAFLNEKVFENVYSMDGGVELWRCQYPIETN
jgi:rhodanese-related sulfurtransferase